MTGGEVSCSAQGNAVRVGGRLKAGLELVAERHDVIGAVHGRGLYLGVDIVRDRTTKEPAPEIAAEVCERMRELGVIIQPTGDGANVLKVKPPLCLDAEGADHIVRALAEALDDRDAAG